MMRDIERRLETLSDVRLPPPPGVDELRERVAIRRRRRHVSLVAGAAVLLLVVVVTVGAFNGVLDRDQPPVIDEPDDPSGEAGETWDPLPEAPLRQRHRHAAVWTGREMLVWGGVVDSGGPEPFANDGAAFNPTTGEWRELPGSPLGDRYDPHAIWTGEEVIIWGGRSHVVEETVQGAAYRPDDDSWRTIADSDLPARVGYSPHAVWTGQEMIVVGVGPEPGGGDEVRRDAVAYHPGRDEWRPLPTLPGDLDAILAAVWTEAELVVSASADGETRTLAYEPGQDDWTVRAPAPAAVVGNRTTVVWSGSEMLVWGIDPSGEERGLAYDPSVDTWRDLPPAPIEAGEFHAWTWTGREMIVWGGATRRGGSQFDDHADGAAYDPGSDTWRRLPDAPLHPRSYATAVWTGSQVLIWGGGWDDAELTGAAYRPGSPTSGEDVAPLPADGERPNDTDAVRWWRRDLGAGGVSPRGSFVVSNHDTVFAVDGDGLGYVNAARLEDGTERWRIQLDPGGGVHLQLATAELLIANPQYEQLVALGTEDGQRVWTFEVPEGYGFVSSTLQDDLLIAVAGTPTTGDTRPPVAYGLDVNTGEQVWAAQLRDSEEPQCMSPVVADGVVIIYTVPDGGPERSSIHALDIDNGQSQWMTEVGEPRNIPACMETSLEVTDGYVHAPLLEGGTVTLDLADGQTLWTSDARLIGSSGQHLVLRDDQHLFTADPATGATLAEGTQMPLAERDLGPRIETETAIVTLRGDRVAFIDPATATVKRQVRLPAPDNEVLVTEQTLIVGSQDQGVYTADLAPPDR